jgi:acid-sensing ion channel, other
VSQLCEQYLFQQYFASDERPNCSKCVQTMKGMMPRREELIFRCFFRLNSLCIEHFSEVITDEGLCYTFNGMQLSSVYREESFDDDIDLLSHSHPSDQWTLEDGYEPNAPLHSYPFRALSSGNSFGLFLIVRTPDEDFDPLCRGPISGFTVVLHTPQSTPATSQNFIRVARNQETTIKVKPNSVITSKNLEKYSAEV